MLYLDSFFHERKEETQLLVHGYYDTYFHNVQFLLAKVYKKRDFLYTFVKQYNMSIVKYMVGLLQYKFYLNSLSTMNSKATVITNLIILVAGLLLCYVHGRENIPHSIVFITGVTLIVPGLINLVLLFSHRNDEQHRPTATMKVAGWISSVASVGLGALMIAAPGLFTPVLVYIFGTVMILAPLMLIYLMSRAVKEFGLPMWLYIGPALVLIGGVTMVGIGQPSITDSQVTLITGIGMVIFSISWLTLSIMTIRARKMSRKPDINDVAEPEA